MLLVVVAYLLGSVPSAVAIARLAAGVDIRELDTGVAGASNVYKHVGPAAGAAVAVLDVSKGALAVGLLLWADAGPVLVAAGAVAVVVGHWWPVFAGFRGGIGAGPAVGAVVVLAPIAFLIAAPFAAAALLIGRRAWPAGSTVLAIPAVVLLVMEGPTATTGTVAGIAVLVLLRKLTWRRRSASTTGEVDDPDVRAPEPGRDA